MHTSQYRTTLINFNTHSLPNEPYRPNRLPVLKFGSDMFHRPKPFFEFLIGKQDNKTTAPNKKRQRKRGHNATDRNSCF